MERSGSAADRAAFARDFTAYKKAKTQLGEEALRLSRENAELKRERDELKEFNRRWQGMEQSLVRQDKEGVLATTRVKLETLEEMLKASEASAAKERREREQAQDLLRRKQAFEDSLQESKNHYKRLAVKYTPAEVYRNFAHVHGLLSEAGKETLSKDLPELRLSLANARQELAEANAALEQERKATTAAALKVDLWKGKAEEAEKRCDDFDAKLRHFDEGLERAQAAEKDARKAGKEAAEERDRLKADLSQQKRINDALVPRAEEAGRLESQLRTEKETAQSQAAELAGVREALAAEEAKSAQARQSCEDLAARLAEERTKAAAMTDAEALIEKERETWKLKVEEEKARTAAEAAKLAAAEARLAEERQSRAEEVEKEQSRAEELRRRLGEAEAKIDRDALTPAEEARLRERLRESEQRGRELEALFGSYLTANAGSEIS